MLRRKWIWPLLSALSLVWVPACAAVRKNREPLPAPPSPMPAVWTPASMPVPSARPLSPAPLPAPRPLPARPEVPPPPSPLSPPPPETEESSEPPLAPAHFPQASQQPQLTPVVLPAAEQGPSNIIASDVPRSEPTAPRAPAVDDPPLVAAMRQLLRKNPEEATAILKRYGKRNQELLLGLLPLAARLSEIDFDRAPPEEWDQFLQQLESLRKPFQRLEIATMCFCRKIEKFGVYEPLEVDHPGGPEFRPGDLVQIYVELRNVTSEFRNGYYVTHLASAMEIRDYQITFDPGTGTKGIVWRQNFPEDPRHPDMSRSPRNDYFINFLFRVPESSKILPGAYTLIISVTDKGQNGPPAQRSLDFRIAPPLGR
ncbi:MAG: hypothetical protein ACK4RK_10130 [Gemmataceae bacterium]